MITKIYRIAAWATQAQNVSTSCCSGEGNITHYCIQQSEYYRHHVVRKEVDLIPHWGKYGEKFMQNRVRHHLYYWVPIYTKLEPFITYTHRVTI